MSVVLVAGSELVSPRVVPLGESDGLTVRRTLPTRQRSFIGGWCFIDHFGPDEVSALGGMRVAPHPHTGLQTVSWLFSGEVEHRDSIGSHGFIRPGEVNLMTSGRGIAHSEMSVANSTALHGVQLWIALPEAHRFVEPAFEHFEPVVTEAASAEVRVFIGELLGATSPVKVYSPLVGAEISLPAGEKLWIPTQSNFEYGILLDHGVVAVNNARVQAGELLYLPTGTNSIEIVAETETQLLLLGGEPLNEEIVMWWNFIGRSDAEIREFYTQWKAEVAGTAVEIQFGWPVGNSDAAEVMPDLPGVRLKARS